MVGAARSLGSAILVCGTALALTSSGVSGAASPSVVRGQGFSLKSVPVDLPYDETLYPDGPGAEVMNANCASCHSASMVLVQPKLSRGQWEAIVTKMRDVYRAPVEADDVPQIVDYLDGLSQSR